MAEKAGSKYAEKVERQFNGTWPRPAPRRGRRTCFKCKRTLSGRKGHGFVSADGKRIVCGACKGPV